MCIIYTCATKLPYKLLDIGKFSIQNSKFVDGVYILAQ